MIYGQQAEKVTLLHDLLISIKVAIYPKQGRQPHKMGTKPTSSMYTLPIWLDRPIHPGRAGLFVSMGKGTHVRRVTDWYELIVVRSGTLEIREENRRFSLKAGQSLLLWPGREHAGVSPYGPDLSFYWAHFTLPDSSTDSRPAEACNQELGFNLHQLSEPARPDYQRELLHRYLDERERGRLHPAQASLLLTQILFEAAQTAPTPDPSDHTTALAGRIDTYIAQNCHEPLSTSAIAEAMNYNEDYLGRIFRRAYGITITEAVHRHQITLAKSMLQSSKMNISEIARHSGFNDDRYFRRIFRRLEGLTPNRYRRMYSRIHINRY